MARMEKQKKDAAKERGFTLRLVFEGVCALVPDSPFFEDDCGTPVPGTPSSVTVLLPDLRSPRIAAWEEESPVWPLPPGEKISYCPPHAPVLLLSPGDIRRRDRGFIIAGRFEDPVTLGPRLVHILGQESVSLNFPKWPRLTFESQIATKNVPTPGTDDSSLWWIPRMSELSPDHQWCYKKLLTDQPGQFGKHKIAARLRLEGGHLAVVDFNQQGKAVWTFGDVSRDQHGGLNETPYNDWKRAIGNVLSCTIQVPGPAVELEFTTADESAKLSLGPPRPGDIVEVKIANAELENLVFEPPSPPWIRPVLPDADFETYYRWTTGGYRRPSRVPLKFKGPGIHEKPCCMVALSGTK
jgi:hypothetical protein